MKFIICFLLSSLSTYTSFSQTLYEVRRLSQPIKLDGKITETDWMAIDPLPLSMYQPMNGGSPSEKTDIRIAYDDEYIYLAASMYDSKPSKIRVNSYERDIPSNGSEFNFFFTGDFQNMEGFSINAAGRRVDAEIRCNTDCPNWFNVDWNIIWYGKALVTSKGWFVEAKIPISNLNFQVKNGALEFGFIAHRLIGRKNERSTYPHIPQELPNGPFRASFAQRMVLKNVVQKKQAFVTPYLLGNIQQINQLNEDETAFQSSSHKDAQIGLDVRYKPFRNSTLDLTLNTDFSQVEVDDQQVNLDRFSLFFPEKRQFFQERSGVFQFGTGGNDRLFHSRRIGLTDDGDQVRILGGVRSINKVRGWDIGILNMQTGAHDSISSENFGVLRLRRQAFNQSSTVGSMFTSRLDSDGNSNVNIGFDATINMAKKRLLAMQYVSTLNQNSSTTLGSSLARIDWQKRTLDGLGYRLIYAYRGGDYNPALGFVNRKDHQVYFGELTFGRFFQESSIFRRYLFTTENLTIRGISNDLIETNDYQIAWGIETLSGNIFAIRFQNRHEYIQEPFMLSDVEIGTGKYSFNGVSFLFRPGDKNLFKVETNIRVGEFFNGTGYAVTVSPNWIKSKQLTMGADFLINNYDFDNSEKFLSKIARLRIRFSFNTRLSLFTFVQTSNLEDKLGTNARIRYNFSDGHDLYFVYNEARNINREESQSVELPSLQRRGLSIKYTYTF